MDDSLFGARHFLMMGSQAGFKSTEVMKKSIRKIPILITFLFLIPSLSLAGQYKVIRIVDGDTVIINYKGKYEKVRF